MSPIEKGDSSSELMSVLEARRRRGGALALLATALSGAIGGFGMSSVAHVPPQIVPEAQQQSELI